MKIYKRVYDCPTNKDGTERPNDLLGDFDFPDGDDSQGYHYNLIAKDRADGALYILKGREVTGIGGGIAHSLEPLIENDYVKAYIKHFK